jgi:hypothetical protein
VLAKDKIKIEITASREGRIILKKRKYGWLQPTNAVQVAQSLLKMDKMDFQLGHQKEALKGTRVLEKMLCGYLLPKINEQSHSKYSVVEEMEQHLQKLLDHTNYVLTLLVPEKRVRLAIESTSIKKK